MRHAALATLFAASIAHSQTPPSFPLVIQHQGRLLGLEDVPVEGFIKLKFSIYAYRDANIREPATLVPLWSATYDVDVFAGVYSTVLGDPVFGDAFQENFFDGSPRFLGITVVGEAKEMIPRLEIGTMPYAVRALHAHRFGGQTAEEMHADITAEIDDARSDAEASVDGLRTEINGRFTSLELPAEKITSGTLADARIPANIDRADADSTFAGAKTFAKPATFQGAVGVQGAATFGSAATFQGPAGFGAPAAFQGTATFQGTAAFENTAAFEDTVAFQGTAPFTVPGGAPTITGLSAEFLDGEPASAFAATVHVHTPSGAAFTCSQGQAMVGVNASGFPVCQPVLPSNLPDFDNDGQADIADLDDDNDGVADYVDAWPFDASRPPFTVNDGSLTANTDKAYVFQPVTASNGILRANWTPRGAAPASWRVRIGTTAGGQDVMAPTTVAGSATSYEKTGLTLQGAWMGTTYYFKVEALDASGNPGTNGTSNGVQIAEAVSWDGSLTGLRQDTTSTWPNAGGSTQNWPIAGWDSVWGSHWFESVDIASSATVRVQAWGKVDQVGAGVTASATSVTQPKDGWISIYANTINVAGTIDATGRGFGGGAAASGYGPGNGGVNGLSGNGGSAGSCGPRTGGTGYIGGGGGAAGSNGGSGQLGGGGGGTCSGVGGDAAAANGGDGGSGDYGDSGAGGASADGVRGGFGSRGGGGGGAGYGAGGGAGGCGCGVPGGGGGTGGQNTSTGSVKGGDGAGPANGIGGGDDIGGGAGGYAARGANGDTTTDASFLLGSGGGGGGGTNHAAGSGGAGGGAIMLVAPVIHILTTGKLKTDAGPGSGGAGGASVHSNGGGGGGGGGGIVLRSTGTLEIQSGSLIRALGGQKGQDDSVNGGDGGSVTSALNGGTIKILVPEGGLSGGAPPSSNAGRVYIGAP